MQLRVLSEEDLNRIHEATRKTPMIKPITAFWTSWRKGTPPFILKRTYSPVWKRASRAKDLT